MPTVPTWPELSYDAWKDTYRTLHLWTQVVGKIRLAHAPWTNHSWHVALYATARGLTTSPIPYGERVFDIELDFLEHRLVVQTADGERAVRTFRAEAVADFYAGLMGELDGLGLATHVNPMPCEIPDAIPFDRDRVHASYDPEQAQRCWRVLVQADRVFKTFRARFVGKCSPVHFFWGSFDLAVTRFSGRPAPPHPGGAPHMPDWVAREAYSHEVSSAGFWPGGDAAPFALFYAYAYPEPPGFRTSPVRPRAARFDEGLGEFVLPYDDVRRAPDPDAALLEFLRSTYEAAANAARWDRAALECDRFGP